MIGTVTAIEGASSFSVCLVLADQLPDGTPGQHVYRRKKPGIRIEVGDQVEFFPYDPATSSMGARKEPDLYTINRVRNPS